MVHGLQLRAGKFSCELAIEKQCFGSAFAILLIKVTRKKELLARSKAVAPLALELHILLVPSR